jgi:hypothetical protein
MFLIVLASIPAGFSSGDAAQTQTLTVRTVPLTIKIVLIGFDSHTIDQDYLTWRGNSVRNSVNNVISSGNITGVNYNLTYNFVYASDALQESLVGYLQSIGQRKIVYNPWFRSITPNYFYDAQKVEDWLTTNSAGYGGLPANGYTFILANLTSLPSVSEQQLNSENPASATPHYYSEKYVDKDLDYQIRYRDFSVGWGGSNRLWFLDMAAGPEFWTWTSSEAVPHLPMQLAIDLYRLDIHSAYGKQWLSQYVADYIYDAVLNLAIPVFVYQPIYSRTYRLVVNVIDNRTDKERQQVPIESTIHPELIKQAFMDLLPYSTIQVETHFIKTSERPDFQATIVENTVTPPADLGFGRYVDTRPVYRYLQEHMSEFTGTIRKDSTEVTVPVFDFAFTAGIYFGYTTKWYVANLKVDEGNFLGISLGDMALIGMSQSDFMRGDYISPPQPGKGMGFTQSTIHEAGHSIGLMHPHQFGYLEDFVSSAMSYWSWEYKFSQFDKDAINRAHADALINSALTSLSGAQNALAQRVAFGSVVDQMSSAKALLEKALEKYGSMQYALAVEIAQRAASAASNAFTLAQTAPSLVVVILVALLAGIVIGSLLIFMAFRRYDRKATRRRRR